MLVQPYSTLRVAYTDELTLETEAAPDRAALLLGSGTSLEYRLEDGKLKLPRIAAPDSVRINWYRGDDLLFTTFLAVVTRHYFRLQQMGVTETFGGGFVWLDHNDVAEVLTPGWSLVSDCQAVGPEGRATIRYRYGLTEVPERVSEAVLRLAAYYLRPSATPERATGEATDAGFIRYTLAGRDGATGLPEVDAAIEQFGRCRAVVM